MTPTQKSRLLFTLILISGLSLATILVLRAFSSNLLFFYTPSQIIAGEVATNQVIRIGGLVAVNSIVHSTADLKVNFSVTDEVNVIPVTYEGVLPDLFKEGQGVVAKGKLNSNREFIASEVLAKHDENYMPPEAAKALEAANTVKLKP